MVGADDYIVGAAEAVLDVEDQSLVSWNQAVTAARAASPHAF